MTTGRWRATLKMGRLVTPSLSAIFGIMIAMLVVLWPGLVSAQYGAANGEWSSYAGDLGGTKYSPLDQIDASNFSDLEIAWRWASADASLDLDALRAFHADLSIRNLRVTPLMVGGTIFVVTPLRLAAALDAGTGATRWLHDPDVVRSTRSSINAPGYSLRGLGYGENGGDARIYYGTPRVSARVGRHDR